MCFLAFLPKLYPGGDTWLDRLLHKEGLATSRITLYSISREIAGITVERQKEESRLKLSTFYVHEDWRGRGIARVMMDSCQARWTQERIRRVHVTAQYPRDDGLDHVFCSSGFVLHTVEPSRYRTGADEGVFVWERPSQYHASL